MKVRMPVILYRTFVPPLHNKSPGITSIFRTFWRFATGIASHSSDSQTTVHHQITRPTTSDLLWLALGWGEKREDRGTCGREVSLSGLSLEMLLQYEATAEWQEGRIHPVREPLTRGTEPSPGADHGASHTAHCSYSPWVMSKTLGTISSKAKCYHHWTGEV